MPGEAARRLQSACGLRRSSGRSREPSRIATSPLLSRSSGRSFASRKASKRPASEGASADQGQCTTAQWGCAQVGVSFYSFRSTAWSLRRISSYAMVRRLLRNDAPVAARHSSSLREFARNIDHREPTYVTDTQERTSHMPQHLLSKHPLCESTLLIPASARPDRGLTDQLRRPASIPWPLCAIDLDGSPDNCGKASLFTSLLRPA